MPEGDGEAEWRDLLFRTRCAVRCGSSSNGQPETGKHDNATVFRPAGTIGGKTELRGQPVAASGHDEKSRRERAG